MSINVYWSCLEDQWMLSSAPEPVSNIFYKNNLYDKKILWQIYLDAQLLMDQ